MFIHLHNHSDGSCADAILKPSKLAKKAKSFGMTAVALTDHGVMFKVIEFYKACKKEGVKPILGMEAYVTPKMNKMKNDKMDAANYHLVLLAENNTGYQNLIKIASDASLEGFYYKPRTDKHKLREWHEGIIALSACVGGEVQKLIIQGEYDKAKECALQYQDIFGKGNFFLEIQDHGIKEEEICREALIRMSKETGIPLVATNDCHYEEPADSVAHDLLLCIRDKTTVSDPKRMRYDSDQMYFKSSEEMEQLFSYCPEAIENTVKIAERCNVEIEFGKNKLPPFDVPEEYESKRAYLEHLVYEGAEEKYPAITQDVKDRITFELDTIERMGYIEYFLIVWDFIRESREKGILIGSGRGSAAGSIVCYCTDIVQLDPLRYGLLFERFLDPSRVTMPDIDIDWQDDRREEGIEYVKQKYGEQSVCQIITFNNQMAKAVVRSVARVLEYPIPMQDKIAKLIPAKPGITLDEVLESVQEFKSLYEEDKDAKKIIDLARRLEGVTTSVGTHAAGVLITDQKGVTAHVPVWRIEDRVVTQYDKDLLEELGLLKMDFLGLSNLTIISDAIKNIKENHGVDVDLYELYQAKDTKPLELVQKGYTQGIFQLESDGMTEFMKELKPDSLEDLTAGIALYRPGPMQYIPNFIRNKRNPKLVTYMFPELEPILKSTYGMIVYQEQCMQTVIAIAGYQKHHSDNFRRILSKKKKDKIPEQREWFINGRPEIIDKDGNMVQDAIPGALKLGFDKDKVMQLFDEMEAFSAYCFNKSHAAAYATIAYVTAWLKYYYPAEFMAALIDKQKSSGKKDSYIKIDKYTRHAKDDLGVQVKLPSVLYSGSKVYAIDKDTIAESLHSKGVDEASMEKLIEIRNTVGIKSMDDFYKNSQGINKKAIESWICIGAFDELDIVRSQHLCIVDTVKKKVAQIKSAQERAEKSKRKTKPVTYEDKVNLEELLPDIREIPDEIKYNLEKIYSGSFLTGHPLDKYQGIINKTSSAPLSVLEYEIDEETGETKPLNPNVKNGQSITCVCIISEIYKTQTRKDKEAMAILTLEDKTGVTKGLLFPDSYKQFKDIIDTLNVFKIEGKIKMEQGEEPVIFISDVEKLKQSVQQRIIFHCKHPTEIQDVFSHIERFKGAGANYTPVYVECGNIRCLLKSAYWVDMTVFERYSHTGFDIEIAEW